MIDDIFGIREWKCEVKALNFGYVLLGISGTRTDPGERIS